MMLPGVITIVTPIVIGRVMGPEALGAYMAGVTVSGVLWAIFQNNAGGAWDNAKKSFEKGVDINGQTYYKKSEPHKAAVVGDTVGDPFKDTSGPSMNILIKLTSLVGLTIAPLIAMNNGGEGCGMEGGCDEEMMECHGMMDACPESRMCEMDSLGNCTVDSSLCASWMAEYGLDSTQCTSIGNGRCIMNKSAMEKIHMGCKDMGHGAAPACEKDCKSACEAQGIECGNGVPCPMMAGKSESCGHHKEAACSQEEKKKDCCKK